ncbi:SDR family NAD(P)-dependent oxidoreductase, partial [archaeon]
MSFGQFAATSQFYLYGRNHCTRTGWENASKKYAQPDILADPNLNLSGKVYLITGANAGIGKEFSMFAASKGATVFMVCRNPIRAEAARMEIVAKSGNSKVHLLLGDCGLETDIRRLWQEFSVHPDATTPAGQVRLDVLICNAGALLNQKALTNEGIEVTLATHLLFGTYLLTMLALPALQQTSQSRVIAMSSGGMYNTKFPAWDVAAAYAPSHTYNGQFAYAFAKRGQVLLMERLSSQYPEVIFLSAHPGWTQTEALDAAYGDQKTYLEPLRTPWQGAEGILYLTVAEAGTLQRGGFYLDRAPQVKHLAGPFFTEGSFTKNSREEVDEMMRQLGQWSSVATRPTPRQIERMMARALPLQAMRRDLDLARYMGAWCVLAVIPTPFEVGAFNPVENYALDSAGTGVHVNFTYLGNAQAKAPSSIQMTARMENTHHSQWTLRPRALGLPLPITTSYLVLHVAPDYGYALVSVPDRGYFWVLTRSRPADHADTSTKVLDMYG